MTIATMPAYAPLTCRNCGDSFTAPERDCPKPSPGRPYQECGRGGHMFFPVEPEPRKPLMAKRLREIRGLAARTRIYSDERGLLSGAIEDLLAERDRLLTECKRLQRVGMESARVGGDPVFTREQIERIFADDKKPRRKRAA